MGANAIALTDFARERGRLTFGFAVDGAPYATSVWYDGVDFYALEARYGAAELERVYFLIAAFTINQFASLAPETLDFGPFARFVDEPFLALWRTVFHNVWAQWRYENGLPHYPGPAIRTGRETPWRRGLAVEGGGTLLFSGGGKDSVVAQSLLASAAVGFDTLGYAHAIYGASDLQHALIEGVTSRGASRRHHRIWMSDDFLDSPVLAFHPEYGIRTLCAAETPQSIFVALPLALAHGYANFVVGHERSADFGNLVWDATGEEVNHQWGKSLEAEALLDDYVATHVVGGLHVYSVLKPFSDAAIFNLAVRDLETLRYAHSCNRRKPWCERCAKCAYVYLNYRAYYPDDFSAAIFAENLFDLPENALWFRQLLGLEEHTPFECVGQTAEARLAFELCRRRGIRGAAIDVFAQAGLSDDCAATANELIAIDEPRAERIPPAVWSRVRAVAERTLAERRKWARSALSSRAEGAQRP